VASCDGCAGGEELRARPHLIAVALVKWVKKNWVPVGAAGIWERKRIGLPFYFVGMNGEERRNASFTYIYIYINTQ
jgi:hypothetical protein